MEAQYEIVFVVSLLSKLDTCGETCSASVIVISATSTPPTTSIPNR